MRAEVPLDEDETIMLAYESEGPGHWVVIVPRAVGEEEEDDEEDQRH